MQTQERRRAAGYQPNLFRPRAPEMDLSGTVRTVLIPLLECLLAEAMHGTNDAVVSEVGHDQDHG